MIRAFGLLLLLGIIFFLIGLARSPRLQEKYLLLYRRAGQIVGRRPLLSSFLLGFLALLLWEKAHKPGHSFTTLIFFLLLGFAIFLFVWGMTRFFRSPHFREKFLLLLHRARRVSGKSLIVGSLFLFGLALFLIFVPLPQHHPHRVSEAREDVTAFVILLLSGAAIFLFTWGVIRSLKPESPGVPLLGCPSAGQLKDLLAERLTSREQARLAAHLDVCTACQHRLEELSAAHNSWPGVARKLSEQSPAPEPALRKVMERMKENPDPEMTRDEPVFSADLPLGFLSPTDKPGHLGRLERYEVQEEIGRGGMGVVLKAFDPSLHRVVAIKVLAPQLATSGVARKRFLREAKAAAAVTHDHIVTIHAVDEANGLPYLVMQYVAGQSLQDRIDKEGPLDLTEILRIGMQTASGLAAAHGHGIVHRDIKPANILLEEGVQRVKITDFGLARAMDDASLTQSGFVAGSPLFMAPEQARGEALDHRADLFSLGSVLYTMCTGRPPFRAANTLAVLRRVSEQSPRPIREIRPEIPDWLAAVVEKLMAKEPAERYSSASEVVEQLGQHLAQMQHAAFVPPPRVPAPAAPEPGLPTSMTLCPTCGASLNVPERLVGSIVHCAECGKPFHVEEGSAVIQVARAVPPPIGPRPRTRRRIPRWVWLAGGCAVCLFLFVVCAGLSVSHRATPMTMKAARSTVAPTKLEPIVVDPQVAATFWNTTLTALPAEATLFGAVNFQPLGPLTLDDARTRTLLGLFLPAKTADQLTPENLGRIRIDSVSMAYYEGSKPEEKRAIVHVVGVALDGRKRIVDFIRQAGSPNLQITDTKRGSIHISGPELPFAMSILDDYHLFLFASLSKDAKAPQHLKALDKSQGTPGILVGYNPPWIKSAISSISSNDYGFLLGEIPVPQRRWLCEHLKLRVCPRSFVLHLNRRMGENVLSLTLNVDKAGTEKTLRDDLEKWRQRALADWQARYPALRGEPKVRNQLAQMMNSFQWKTDRGSVRGEVKIPNANWWALAELVKEMTQ